MTKGTKIALGITIPLLVIGGGALAYRNFVPPKFLIEEIDRLNKGGMFTFSGEEHYFGGVNSSGGASVIVGRGNWQLKYAYDEKGAFFILMKDNEEIKELERITY